MRWIGQSADVQFGNAVATAAAVRRHHRRGTGRSGTARTAGRYFSVMTSSLSELFGMRLTGALGLTAGFSSLDGD